MCDPIGCVPFAERFRSCAASSGGAVAAAVLAASRGAAAWVALLCALAIAPIAPAAQFSGTGGPAVRLTSSGDAVRAPGSTLVVEVRAENLPEATVGMQLLLEWDVGLLNYVSAAGGDDGFALLREPTVYSEGSAPTRRQLSVVTGVFTGSAGVTEGVLARVTFVVTDGMLFCTPVAHPEFGYDSPVMATKLTAAGGAEIEVTLVEDVEFVNDAVAPTLVGVPASVTLAPGQTSSPELDAFVASTVTATDNCGAVVPVRSVVLPDGTTSADYPSTFPEGLTTVTWTATDAAANSDVEVRTVFVDPCPGPFVTYFRDSDGDGFGVDTDTETTCVGAPAGYVVEDGDCDDADATSYPEAPELCATVGTDNNCNGNADDVDADAPDKSDFYGDADGDGYGDPAVVERACTAPAGFVANAGDACPDNGALIAPVSYFVDGDGDGFGGTATASFCQTSAPAGHSSVDGDCDDTDGTSYPEAPELCATVGTDNNCNGNADDVDADAPDKSDFYGDADGDGYGDPAVVERACTAPAGFVANAGDCADSDPSINPGAPEICNGIDDNCVGGADDGLEFRPYFLDIDGDGYGDSSTETSACAAPGDDWVTDGGDDCPNDPAKLEPGDCGCGVAETDTDFDTVPDCIDNCPDVPNATQADCDGDGVGDACSTAEDCNDNGIPDSCDLASGASADVDGDGIPDSCQADCNKNGLPDSYEIASGAIVDCDSNGVPDECEDGYIEGDTGDMGAVGAEEPVEVVLTGQEVASTDVRLRLEARGDLDGPNEYLVLTLNGVPVGGDLFATGGSECPAEPDSIELTLSMHDWMNVMENATTAGRVRVRLVASAQVSASECANGLSRVSVSYGGSSFDCDGDGQPDSCQLAAGEGDCNGNGIFDACERGTITDTDADGRPDSCERAYGDFNLDGVIDGIDLCFVLVAWSETTGGICDLDNDGDVDGNDLSYLLTRWGPVP